MRSSKHWCCIRRKEMIEIRGSLDDLGMGPGPGQDPNLRLEGGELRGRNRGEERWGTEDKDCEENYYFYLRAMKYFNNFDVGF